MSREQIYNKVYEKEPGKASINFMMPALSPRIEPCGVEFQCRLKVRMLLHRRHARIIIMDMPGTHLINRAQRIFNITYTIERIV